MVRPRFYVGPNWPPPFGFYNYMLSLIIGDVAWEYLRRNEGYQRMCARIRKCLRRPRRTSRHPKVWRLRAPTPSAQLWGLDPFCRSGVTCAGCPS